MSCAILDGASMKVCNFEDPHQAPAILEGCPSPTVAFFKFFYIVKLIFEGASMKGANLEGSQMRGAVLRVACLKNASLRNCDLRSAVLAGADLEV